MSVSNKGPKPIEVDISAFEKADLSLGDIEKFQAILEAKKKAQREELKAKLPGIKQEVEEYVKSKYGVTLREVWTASSKPTKEPVYRYYKHPEVMGNMDDKSLGGIYRYHKGTLPKPLSKLSETKRAEFEVEI